MEHPNSAHLPLMLEKEMTENSEMSKRVQGHPFCNKKGLKKRWSLLRGTII
jgi:hypothetical protein